MKKPSLMVAEFLSQKLTTKIQKLKFINTLPMSKLTKISFFRIRKTCSRVIFLFCITQVEIIAKTEGHGDAFGTTHPQQKHSCFIMHADNDPFLPEIDNVVITLKNIPSLKVIYARNGENNGLTFGSDMNQFMRQGIEESDYVIALYSPTFYNRSKLPLSGISFELTLLLDRLLVDRNSFFIPFLLPGCNEKFCIPTRLRNYLAIKSNVGELISTLAQRIMYKRENMQPKMLESPEETVVILSQDTQHSQITVQMSSIHSTPASLETIVIRMSTGSPGSPLSPARG